MPTTSRFSRSLSLHSLIPLAVDASETVSDTDSFNGVEGIVVLDPLHKREQTPRTLWSSTPAAATASDIGQTVAFSASPTVTAQPSASDLGDNASSSSSPTATAVSASSSDIPIGTVVGACLGALAGCVLIILVGLWLYKSGNKPRPRSPSNAHKADKERAWISWTRTTTTSGRARTATPTKRWPSVGPMEKLTMFKNSSPSVRTAYTTAPEPHDVPAVTHFDHPFAQYHPNLAKEFAQDNGAELPTPRPFLARVEVAPISWDGDTVGRDSFLSLSSNHAASPSMAVSPGTAMAIPTPKLTSSEPHMWESAEVMQYDENGVRRSPSRPNLGRRKSANNPFFGARMSTYSTTSRSRSQSRSRTPSFTSPSKVSLPDTNTMPAPPPVAYTREEKGKYRAATPPSPTISMAPSTITGHDPFSDPIVPIRPDHSSHASNDRAMQSLIAALGTSAADVQERLRVASMNPSIVSESVYTDADEATLGHQSWPVPPSRP
ncbi:hypothetical protein DFH06DRAFT_1138815 [Mycena polygramma]|nr:hypothetical protein DFH06DRAFT_1138815 [Mycena polygramma]